MDIKELLNHPAFRLGIALEYALYRVEAVASTVEDNAWESHKENQHIIHPITEEKIDTSQMEFIDLEDLIYEDIGCAQYEETFREGLHSLLECGFFKSRYHNTDKDWEKLLNEEPYKSAISSWLSIVLQ